MGRKTKAVKRHKTKGFYSVDLPGSPTRYHYWGTTKEAEALQLLIARRKCRRS